MALWTTVHSRAFPAGTKIWEIVRLTTSDATTATAALDYVSRLRYIENVQWGKSSTPTLVTDTQVTWTNATTYPGHATLTVMGMSTTALPKTFDFELVGGW